MTTTEGNKILMDFLGWEKVDDETYKFPNLYPIYDLDEIGNTGWTTDNVSNAIFHKSWDWIMKVVEKIESLPTDKNKGEEYQFSITGECISITRYDDGSGVIAERENKLGENKIMEVWECCVDFCKWYEINKTV